MSTTNFSTEGKNKLKLDYFVNVKASAFASDEEGGYVDLHFAIPSKFAELIMNNGLNGFSFEDDPKHRIYTIDEVDLSSIPQ